MITQEQYLELIEPLTKQCLCASPNFQKLVSFNFQDYSIAPTSLSDSEIFIQKNIRERFTAQSDWSNNVGEVYREYVCPICKRKCKESYAEYSINMYRSYVTFEENLKSESVSFLTGFRSFTGTKFDGIKDFEITTDRAYYLDQFNPKSDRDRTPHH
jgi:hypothetical protein